MADFIRAIIGLTIGIVVFASLYMTTVKNTNTTYVNPANGSQTLSWSAQEITLWGLLSIVGIVGIVYSVLNVFGIG